MTSFGRGHLVTWAACLWPLTTAAVRAEDPPARSSWEWATASPESQGMTPAGLESAWAALKDRQTTALLVVRHDRIVFERYAPGFDRHKPHGTASLAKALVGGLGLMVAMGDGRISPDDPAGLYVPRWRDDPERQAITVRHLATHTSGVEDAEADGLPHDRLTGWKGDFWKRLPPPHDPFTLARDRAPVLDVPGTRERYSNPGMAMLGYCVTASLRGTGDADLRSLLKHRIMGPLGVPDAEWSVGYGTTTTVDGLPLVATWGGGSYSPDAVARVGRLLLNRGAWEDRQVIAPAVVDSALRHERAAGPFGAGVVGEPGDGRDPALEVRPRGCVRRCRGRTPVPPGRPQPGPDRRPQRPATRPGPPVRRGAGSVRGRPRGPGDLDGPQGPLSPQPGDPGDPLGSARSRSSARPGAATPGR